MCFERNLQHFFIVVFSLIQMQCTAQKKSKKAADQNDSDLPELLLYIQQSPCLGKCPDYEASFYTGKKMVYEGRAHMPVLGKYEYLLPADFTKNLIFEAVKMNVKLVLDSTTLPPDVPVVRLWVTINGKMKKMVGFVGGDNQTFTNYVKLVHGEVKAMVSEQEGIKIP